LPSLEEDSVLANLLAMRGARFFWMGLKARWACVGLREAARIDRWNPLRFIELAFVPSSIGFRMDSTHCLNMMGDDM
jgi:hypothetical protein